MSEYIHINAQNGIYQKSYTSLISNSLKISHRILFQCTAISNSFLSIGCNTGNIYVFNIDNSKFKYWSNIISNDSPVLGMQFSPSNFYLAYHNKKLQLFIYKLSLVNEKSLLIRLIECPHNSPLQSLLWDYTGSKIFCGYSNGVVDVNYIPQNTKDYFHVQSEGLMKLDRQIIVQMDFMKDLLLVSTNEKVILMNFQSKYMTAIGTKPRSGQYGACFWYEDSKQLRIVSARPSYRLWIASLNGTVDETQQYKTYNDSLKYKLRDNESSLPGSGQFSYLSMIKNSNLMVALEYEGLLFIIDLVKKSAISIIDYGCTLTKVLCTSENIILNSQREVICLAVTTFKESLLNILNEEFDYKVAIDLFLSLTNGIENTDNASYSEMDFRLICNSLSPDLLSKLVQKSADLEYRFIETNKLQVYIQDNVEYQNIFCSIGKKDFGHTRATSSNVDSSNDASTESDGSYDSLLNRRSGTKPKKLNAYGKTPQLLKTIYDKTTNFLSNIDVMSSSNSELNMVDSFSELIIHDGLNEVDSNSRQTIADNIPENIVPVVNLMELEANGYIATEKFKQHHVDDDSQDDFKKSLFNFCETWLTLNLHYWKQLRNFELHVRNLSATFPVLHQNVSVSSSDSFNAVIEDNFINEHANAKFSCAWSSTINVSDWIKPLPVSDKIYLMTSNLLSQCFFYETFCRFPHFIQKLIDITDDCSGFSNCESSVQSYSNIYFEEFVDKETQTINFDFSADIVIENHKHHYLDLNELLNNCIWSASTDFTWIRPIIKHFYAFLNIKLIREWVKSGIPHIVWLAALEGFKDVCLSDSLRETIANLSNKTDLDIEKYLFNSLCTDDVHSFVIVNEVLSIMKKKNIINWKILIESENLDSRDILHFSLKYNLDLTDYILQLFKYVSFSIRFSSRYSLLEAIYSHRDVLISFIYSLLSNASYSGDKSPICECGLLICYIELNLPENINSLAIEILRWGAHQGVFKKDSKLLDVLMKLCLDATYHQGYVELLVGMSVVKELVKIGIQVRNIHILERLKDCSSLSSGLLMEVTDFIISCRRKQIKHQNNIQCVSCEKSIDYKDNQSKPLLWKDIGKLLFTNFIEENYNLQIMQKILPKLTLVEMDQMKELLISSVETIVSNKKIVERNQMLKFIKAEINLEEASGELTERYLNIYTMSRHELSGPNWGRVITDNMMCDLCGTKLINKSDIESEGDITAFCCTHTFHKDCLLQFDSTESCFLC